MNRKEVYDRIDFTRIARDVQIKDLPKADYLQDTEGNNIAMVDVVLSKFISIVLSEFEQIKERITTLEGLI